MSAHEVEGDAASYNDVRLACTCGRFLAESAIRCTDKRDPSAYYGVGTDVEWDCSCCGAVTDHYMPQIVVVATRPISPAERGSDG